MSDASLFWDKLKQYVIRLRIGIHISAKETISLQVVSNWTFLKSTYSSICRSFHLVIYSFNVIVKWQTNFTFAGSSETSINRILKNLNYNFQCLQRTNDTSLNKSFCTVKCSLYRHQMICERVSSPRVSATMVEWRQQSKFVHIIIMLRWCFSLCCGVPWQLWNTNNCETLGLIDWGTMSHASCRQLKISRRLLEASISLLPLTSYCCILQKNTVLDTKLTNIFFHRGSSITPLQLRRIILMFIVTY